MRTPLIAAVVALALALAACGSDDEQASAPEETTPAAVAPTTTAEPAPEPPVQEPDPEPTVDDYDDNAKNLSVIDDQGDSDLRAVQQRSRALDVLEKKCPEEERSRLADYATVAKQEAEKEDVEITTLQALRGVNKSIPPSMIGKVDCQEQFAAYIALVVSGVDP